MFTALSSPKFGAYYGLYGAPKPIQSTVNALRSSLGDIPLETCEMWSERGQRVGVVVITTEEDVAEFQKHRDALASSDSGARLAIRNADLQARVQDGETNLQLADGSPKAQDGVKSARWDAPTDRWVTYAQANFPRFFGTDKSRNVYQAGQRLIKALNEGRFNPVTGERIQKTASRMPARAVTALVNRFETVQ